MPDMLSRNVDTELQFNGAQYPRTAQISPISRRKPEITQVKYLRALSIEGMHGRFFIDMIKAIPAQHVLESTPHSR
jgi:hypothetical protein